MPHRGEQRVRVGELDVDTTCQFVESVAVQD